MATTSEVRGFATGEHVVLRPVLEDDLRALAALLAENPCESTPTPWTHQRLKKKFEDEKDPGLWGRKEKFFLAVRKADGEAVGFIKERNENWAYQYYINFHIAGRAAGRDELGTDMLKTYIQYQLGWSPVHRISAAILKPEEAKAGWLEAAGFKHEFDFERMYMYLGEPTAESNWGWLRDEQGGAA